MSAGNEKSDNPFLAPRDFLESQRTGESRTVAPDGDQGWKVVKPGSSKPSAVATTQGEAVEIAKKQIVKSGGGQVYIHGRDGRIRHSDTIRRSSKDPQAPRG